MVSIVFRAELPAVDEPAAFTSSASRRVGKGALINLSAGGTASDFAHPTLLDHLVGAQQK